MEKKSFVAILIITIILTLACSFSYEGIAFGVEQENKSLPEQMEMAATFEVILAENTESAPAAATPEPEYQSIIPSDSEDVVAGSHEYRIKATNFDCICQETANMTVDFNFMGDKVEVTNKGGATMVYDKIGDNQYKRSFMGYYILVSGEGSQAAETKVEQEEQVVITLTDKGYVLESYKGSSGSPCCYYTFTIEK